MFQVQVPSEDETAAYFREKGHELSRHPEKNTWIVYWDQFEDDDDQRRAHYNESHNLLELWNLELTDVCFRLRNDQVCSVFFSAYRKADDAKRTEMKQWFGCYRSSWSGNEEGRQKFVDLLADISISQDNLPLDWRERFMELVHGRRPLFQDVGWAEMEKIDAMPRGDARLRSSYEAGQFPS